MVLVSELGRTSSSFSFSFILFVVCHTDRRFYQLERLLEEDELSCEHQNHHNEDLEYSVD